MYSYCPWVVHFTRQDSFTSRVQSLMSDWSHTQLCHCPSIRAGFNSLRSSWENIPCSSGAPTSVECIVTKTLHMADTDAHTIYLFHNKYPREKHSPSFCFFRKRKLRHNTNMYINLKVTCPQVATLIISILTQSLSHWLLNVMSDFKVSFLKMSFHSTGRFHISC